MPEALHTGFYFTPTLHKDTYPAIDPSKLSLEGKYVFITGASKGIGHATALSYARAGVAGLALGARSDLSALPAAIAAAASSAGTPAPKVHLVSLDVTDEASTSAAAASVAAAFPRLDILVNNAGYLEIRSPIAESDPEEWWKTWTVNIKGPYLVTRAFLPQMLDPARGGDKTIVNLSSLGAHLFAPGASAYQPTKLALLRFTEFVDVEYAGQGVLAFAVHPGGVLTDMGKRLPKERHSALTETPELAADTIVFLTAKRPAWIAARYVAVTWDMEEFLAKEKEVVEGDKLKVRMIV